MIISKYPEFKYKLIDRLKSVIIREPSEEKFKDTVDKKLDGIEDHLKENLIKLNEIRNEKIWDSAINM